MTNHEPIPLPDPSTLPHGLVKITVWKEVTTDTERDFANSRSWSGKTYIPHGDKWIYTRRFDDILQGGDVVDWSYDGISLDYFNRGYLLQEENNPGPLVRLAMWAFDRWAVDMGLKDRMDKPRLGLFVKKVKPGESVQFQLDTQN